MTMTSSRYTKQASEASQDENLNENKLKDNNLRKGAT